MPRLPLPSPRRLPWALKPETSAKSRVSYDPFGRMVMEIEHDLIRGVTPIMLARWFANIGGTVEVEGKRLNRYLVWHPFDHVLWELAKPDPDDGAGKGAHFRIVEAFGANPRFYIDVTEEVLRLDTGGLTLAQKRLGQEVSRLNHDFVPEADGTRYLSTLTVGFGLPVIGPLINPLLHLLIFPEAMGRAWIRHNIEEVGAFEHLLPLLESQAWWPPG
jgi:hypothetical protein